MRYENELEHELILSKTEIIFKNSKLFIVAPLAKKPLWSQDWWPQVQKIPFKNKNEALKILKGQKNRGYYYAAIDSPLATSLRKDLRELKLKRIEYQVPSLFDFKYFSWTLLENDSLLICPHPVSQFPGGWHEFNEDKSSPPNRAYLKLWEVLALNYIELKKEDVAIDLGSSPGGWSWVLSEQVAKVYSIDKAPLEPQVSGIKNILYEAHDAFTIKPTDYPDITWLFSDIICTPERLLELVEFWQTHSRVRNFVCTIKFKGECDFDMLKKFEKFEGSRIIHLYHNKNEVTWIRKGTS
ncbi:MAG: hypothetical protein H7061_02860 [Bdellovibrionaceae bacterium]|nr:hypothetical protein [Bdellovibrio sp.]